MKTSERLVSLSQILIQKALSMLVTNLVRVCLRETNKTQLGRTADFLCYFSKMPRVMTLHVRLCSDLAYVYSSQSSCILVEQMAPFSATIEDFPKLVTTFVDSRVTNLVLATCHACMDCVQ